MAEPEVRRLRSRSGVAAAALGGLLVGVGLYGGATLLLAPHRTTPVYDPPVLAGQFVPGLCSAGFYARLGDQIVVTSSEHCAGEGTVARDPATGVVAGVIGPTDQAPSCPFPGYKCAASDMNFLIVAPDRIPWGHLNLVDMGVGGYRVITPGERALSCADIVVGAKVEIDGRGTYRTGHVVEKGENHKPLTEDGSYFPCMIAADVHVGGGDSGGSVFVNGLPAGVTSRSYGGYLGFTPLAEGLAEMGLVMCDSPDCGLTPPG